MRTRNSMLGSNSALEASFSCWTSPDQSSLWPSPMEVLASFTGELKGYFVLICEFFCDHLSWKCSLCPSVSLDCDLFVFTDMALITLPDLLSGCTFHPPHQRVNSLRHLYLPAPNSAWFTSDL